MTFTAPLRKGRHGGSVTGPDRKLGAMFRVALTRKSWRARSFSNRAASLPVSSVSFHEPTILFSTQSIRLEFNSVPLRSFNEREKEPFMDASKFRREKSVVYTAPQEVTE
jgi:hypothetical protein